MGLELGGRKSGEPLETLNALAREARDQVADASPAEVSAGWAGVVARMRRQQARRKAYRFSLAGVSVAATVAAVLTLVPSSRLWSWNPPRAALAYRIQGGSVVDGGYLRESGRDGIALRFAEGSEMSLKAGTRGRLRAVTSTGARIAIEHGTARFRITPRRDGDWSVEVGPFLVAVKGTIFTVGWNAVTEHFDLVLERGAVSVTGPVSRGEILLKEGQHLAVDLPRKQTIITESNPDGSWPAEGPSGTGAGLGEDPGDTARPAAAEEPEARVAPAAPSPWRQRTSSMEVRPLARRGWAQAVATGNWDRILADVDRAGVRPTLAQASSEDLLALADAARYRRRTDLARAALLADRRRFPASSAALEAAYLLGRLAESERSGLKEALGWYDTYLAGAPGGPYASEALGRKMIATKQSDDTSAARALAQEYLRRFPAGSYAGAARAVLSASP